MRRSRERSEPLRGAGFPRGGPVRGGGRADSLDTDKKLLKTSVAKWNKSQSTEEDKRFRVLAIHARLVTSLREISLRHAFAAEKALQQGDKDTQAREERKTQKWQRKMERIRDCQTQWMGFRASCCGVATRPMAVPIGCNERLCPLCCWQRSQKARERIQKLFGRLQHSCMITLTVPNKAAIRKHDFKLFRQRVRQLLAMYKPPVDENGEELPTSHRDGLYVRGGVYSIETTYNRAEKTWHIHAHVLAEICDTLPEKGDYVTEGRRMYRFTAQKMRLEFDWLRLWINDFGKPPRKNAPQSRHIADQERFCEWVRTSYAMRLKEYRNGEWVPISLPLNVRTARGEWNAKYRRTVHIRPVDNREKAAREVLKYITKVSDLADVPEALEPFSDAVKGARLIQTFGSWYGFNPELDEPQDGRAEWGRLDCTCGANEWEKMGCFFRKDIEFATDGRAYLKPPHDHNSRGGPMLKARSPGITSNERIRAHGTR